MPKVWDLSRGFLPEEDPVEFLPSEFKPWEDLAHEAPKLLAAGKFGDAVKDLPLLDPASLHENEAMLECAMRHLSFLGHSEIWENWKEKPRLKISKQIAVPWHKIAKQLGRPPVLSYASYALYNWKRLDITKPVQLGNIALLQNFLGGLDEEWFILVHVDIESRAQAIIFAIEHAVAGVPEKGPEHLENWLYAIELSLQKINSTLNRMTENCDPYIYYNRVRPYIYGWKNHLALPKGLIYEGVEEYNGAPQQFRGETGAQSTIIPSLDAFLGIEHADKLLDGSPDILKSYLMEMRDYMPKEHRDFLEKLEKESEENSVCRYVLALRNHEKSLADAYNACVEEIAKFRQKHLEYAGAYIQKQSQKSAFNPNTVGTGGTPFMQYLKKHLDETTASLID